MENILFKFNASYNLIAIPFPSRPAQMRDVLVTAGPMGLCYACNSDRCHPNSPNRVSLVQQITQSIRVQAYHAKTSYCFYGALSTFVALRIYQITPRHTTLAREG
jgi:hypothetical protein